ncbi:hypothetical protein NXS19_002448 [Fusarium pseudograminearum]|nr:hypothetical protein NXS19_002448 [Fusarium pseudograminearum]
MENPNNGQAHFEPSKLVLGRVAADLFDTDVDSLDWGKSFIMLGGDSILAIDFIVRCRDAGILVDMRDLLTAGTLAQLAESIAQQNTGAGNGVNGHANGNGMNGNGLHNKATIRNGSDDLTTSAAAAGRRLRFATMEIPENTDASIISTAMERIVDRHSALRSNWSISSTGKWIITTASGSGLKSRQFFYGEFAEATEVTDAFEWLRKALLSDELFPSGCLVIPSDAPGCSHTIVLAADANVVDALSMGLVLRELRETINGTQLELSSDFQFSDWIARGCQGLEAQVERANTTKSNSITDTGALKLNGNTRDNIDFQLSRLATERLFAAQTHAALRTSPVDIVNAAVSQSLGPRYRDTENVLTIISAYSIREEKDIPLDSIGCYEVETELAATAPVPGETLVHLVRQMRDARAGFSADSRSSTAIYVDCTRLCHFEEGDYSPWLSDPTPDHSPYVSLAMIAGQVHVSLHFGIARPDDKLIADRLRSCLDEIVDELAKAPRMGTLHDFPLVRWSYSALDGLARDLQTHGLDFGDIESIGPSTSVQESFFVSQAINPGSYVSHATLRLLPTSANVPRRVETEKVVRAWSDIVERHAMLRTAFAESNDRPGKFDQLVFKPTALPPRVIVISSSAETSIVSPFTAGRFESPLRLCIYEINAEELRLELEISHALVDGHSAKILLHDIRASYLQSAYFSQSAPLPYTVFASRQQATLSEGEASAGITYWTSYLNEASESHLPLITTNPQLKDLETTRCSVSVPDGKLRAVCGELSITPANLFHVAWALALRRIILSDRITFSYIVSGRNSDADGVEATVGPFVNTLPFALALNPENSIADVLGSAKQDWQNGLQFQNIPIADLAAAKTRSLKRLGNTLLSIEREGSNTHPFTEGTYMSLDARTSAADFDLIANIRFNEQRINLSVEYWASRIAGPVAKAQMAAFEDAVSFLLEGVDLSVRDFPSHSPQDRAAFIRWNSTKPARLESCVHELVVEKMAEQPEALAVSSWDGELTYGELERASRRLAYHLVEKGVGPEVMVGMCMEKSKLGVVAMVATLLAGGGLVPLGVSHPLARIEGIVKDAASPLILVDRVHEERLAELGSYTELVAVDSFFDNASSTAIPSSGPFTSVGPDNVAWMIFTSGSTGKPKGVVLEHGSLATSILYHGRRLDIQPHDRLLQFAAFTFDAAIQEIITALAFGATTCIPSESDRMDRLSNYLAESKVTIATLTSTVAALVRPQETPTVRTIILMGEAVQAKVVDQWIDYATVINAYGPSECCIHSTCRPVTDSSASLNIGTAIAGATWVVNPTNINQLVPLGGQGELLLEGPLLARGYLNDSAKTAQAFVTDPAFVRELELGSDQHRMYRTGDLVQQNTDGTLTYLGRIDSQIKIRGQRVEIGEIEYHIGKQGGVHDAVVLYMRQGPLADRLVAAVNLGESSSVDRPQTSTVQVVSEDHMANARLRLREVQHGLSRQVMHYMVPSIWLPLSAMPMNQSGKTDRRALTDWIQSLSSDDIAALSNGGDADDVDDISATAVERELRQIWSEVLAVPLGSVTYSSSFFSLGGDSITAMQVVSASRSRGILITVRKVLDCQTIPELAAEAQATQNSDYAAVPEGALALSPIQQMYFESIAADGLRADNEHCFNQGVLLHVTRQITLAELTRALDMAVAKHAMLRARFQYSQEQGWQQRIEREVTGSYRLCAHTAGDTEMSGIVAQSQSTLDIENGPVFAADLIEREDRQVLHLVAHHLVIDLVSWRILLRDLEEVIVNQKLPNPSSLSFPTWLGRQKESLSKVSNVLDTLPMIVPKTNWTYWGLTPGQETFGSRSSTQARCDIETTSLLTGGANSPLKTEPVEILLAGLLLSFQQVFADRPVPTVFTEGHGREAPDDGTDLSETIGWFTTMSPIYVSFTEASSNGAIDVLRQVKDQRRRIPGRGVPYFGSRFLTAQGKEQFAGHGPAEIMFNYTGRFQQLERDDALFHFDRDNNSSTMARAGDLVKLFAALDVAITIEAGELCITVHYSNQSRCQEGIRRWVEVYGQTVKSLVNALNTVEPMATATDFPLARLSDSDMETIEGQYLPMIGLTSSAEIEDILPCSPIQQGILLTQLQSPSTYCIYQTCRIVPSGDAPVSADRLIALGERLCLGILSFGPCSWNHCRARKTSSRSC